MVVELLVQGFFSLHSIVYDGYSTIIYGHFALVSDFSGSRYYHAVTGVALLGLHFVKVTVNRWFSFCKLVFRRFLCISTIACV